MEVSTAEIGVETDVKTNVEIGIKTSVESVFFFFFVVVMANV